MEEWLTGWKFPLGEGMKAIIEYLKTNGRGFFDIVSNTLEFVIEGVTTILLMFPPLVLIGVIVAFAWWLHRSWKLCVFIAIVFIFVANLGYWKPTVETLSLVTAATFVSVVIGVPIGIAAAHRPWLYTILRPVLDLMQTVHGTTCVVLSGGNVDLGVVPGLIGRHETQSGRRLILFVTISDRPGGLARLLAVFAEAGASVIDIEHVREGVDLHVRETGVHVVLEVRSAEHADAVRAAVLEAGYSFS